MKNIWFRRVVVGPIRTNCYLIGLQDRQDCVGLDPGDSAEKILKAADGRQIAAILFTHGHFDHIAAGKALPGCRVYIHAEDAEMLTSPSKNGSLFLMDEPVTGPEASVLVKDGDVIEEAGLSFRVIHTPGHSRGSVCYQVEDMLFTGDTLMSMGVGRTDLWGGSEEDLMASLEKIQSLEHVAAMYGGHG